MKSERQVVVLLIVDHVLFLLEIAEKYTKNV